MLLVIRCVLLTMGCLLSAQLSAQIYTCTAEDGTRIFSDEKCGPDAKIVPNITAKRTKPAEKAASKPRVTLPPEQLERLLRECNAGDMNACKEWTHGGGPNHLREQERQAGVACDGGSLPDCERRYCADGVTEECRRRVLGAAKIAGDTWYLRSQRAIANGGTSYEVRCVVEGVRTVRDVTIECSGLAGPNRCELLGTGQRFARLDQAAAKFCSQ